MKDKESRKKNGSDKEEGKERDNNSLKERVNNSLIANNNPIKIDDDQQTANIDQELNQDKKESAVVLLQKAHFCFRNLNEARILGAFLSNVCPNPRLANVGLCELFINAVEHGNLHISYEEKTRLQKKTNWLEEVERRLELPENKHKCVDVYFTRTETEIQVKVIDQGQGFDWKKYQKLEDLQKIEHNFHTHGKGIIIAKHLSFDEMEYGGKGNEVTVTILLSGGTTP